ncbi:SDR family oxidoreductase [Niabella pedocola]|uniref:SDR family oxidoreductase n=1 Tax=Niabella pedocola TaxID=1752077 RepID=A0ABS8PN73_9BACT|nr:SDR family oxidoreductase [Niabella pedocola]MCD2422546.1 SDR family oxidoreductase [Niabella pedocola]
MKSDRKVLLLTGAAGGIGRATAERFARDGFALALVDIDAEGLNVTASVIKQFTDACLLFPGDLQEPAFLETIVDNTLAQWGRIDVLVNNAAWRSLETLATLSLEHWEKTIRINLTAPAFLSRITAGRLIALHQSCVIINISSIMAELAGGYAPAYTVCKGAIESLTYELSVLYGPKGFRSVAIRPGNVHTPLNDDYNTETEQHAGTALISDVEQRTPLQRSATAHEMANAVCWLASEEASFITGTVLTIDGGLSKNFNAYSLKQQLKPNEF